MSQPEPHRATDEEWAKVEYWHNWHREGKPASDSFEYSCLLELRDRIKLLEATQHVHLSTAPDGPLLAPLEDEPTTRRRFVSLTRTVNPDGTHTIDAICHEGRAWWLIVGSDEAPEDWTELYPLPEVEQ